MEQYLQILADSLVSKEKILTQLIEESNRQAEYVKAPKVDWKAFDASVEQKGKLLEELNQLDQGFDTVYQRIKEGLQTDRSRYKIQIQKIQELIKRVTEKSSELMATEQRNKVLVTNRFAEDKKKFSLRKTNAKNVASYYQNMNRLNYIDPQLMDKKK